MNNLVGEFPCKVDLKGRVRLPSALLEQLPVEESDQFIVSRGFDNCLYLYTRKAWDVFMAQVNSLNLFDEKSRQFQRLMYRGATPVKRDNVDRLNIPNPLLQYAGLQGEAVLFAVSNRIEIWSAVNWEEQQNVTPEMMTEYSQEVLGGKNPFTGPGKEGGGAGG